MHLKKIPVIALFLPLVFFAACSGSPSAKQEAEQSASTIESSFFSSMPSANGLVFIGAAGKRSDPKDTIRLALEDAAKRAAIFYSVYGEYAMENNIGSGTFDYTYNVHAALSFNEEGASQYIEDLIYNSDIDTIEIENVFFIRTTYPSALPFPINYRPVYDAQGKPDWVENPPSEINGYEVSVGFSGRHSSMADTYTNSRNNAIFGIIRNINSVSQTSDVQYTSGNIFGYKTTSENITFSYGTLTGFYVIDTWIDQSVKTIWTLAIARKV